jgi:hypothetical protein
MIEFALGFMLGWVLFKRPDWASTVLMKIAEKTRTGMFKF